MPTVVWVHGESAGHEEKPISRVAPVRQIQITVRNHSQHVGWRHVQGIQIGGLGCRGTRWDDDIRRLNNGLNNLVELSWRVGRIQVLNIRKWWSQRRIRGRIVQMGISSANISRNTASYAVYGRVGTATRVVAVNTDRPKCRPEDRIAVAILVIPLHRVPIVFGWSSKGWVTTWAAREREGREERRQRDWYRSNEVLNHLLAAVGQDCKRGDLQHLIAAGWIVGKARAVVVDRGSRVRIAVKVDTEGVLRDAVDAHPFVRGTLNTASVGDRIDVGSRIGHRVGSRRKLRLKFIIAISRSGIPGRHARSIDDVDGAADGKRCARRRQEARRRSALERVGILRRKPATTLFKARERRVVDGGG